MPEGNGINPNPEKKLHAGPLTEPSREEGEPLPPNEAMIEIWAGDFQG